jgi:mevalonate kinase
MKAIAEAPAKVIITGEHFVVHGAWALAAAIPRTVTVEVEEHQSFVARSELYRDSHHPALRPLGEVVESMAREYSFSPKVRVSVRSNVPAGAGLGSSASTMVALASALSRLHSLGLGAEELVGHSMVGEAGIHGRPSGIDPTVCALGGVIMFRPGSSPRRIKLDRTRSFLVSFSGKTRNTRGQINRVAEVKARYPGMFSGLVESASAVSEMAAERLARNDMKGLGRLLSFNHAVLSNLGVSNEDLDRLVDASLLLGCYGAKLTGAGGGGSVISVAPEGKQKRISSGLNARGFETFRAEIPVRGVRSWLEP